jgi:hypothetical protein
MLSHRPGSGVAVARLVPCGRRACPGCGPWARQQRADTLAGLAVAWRLQVADTAWRSLAAKLRRAGVESCRIPVGGGLVLVLLSRPWPGAAEVGDVRGVLRAACAQLPARARISRSQGWPATRRQGSAVETIRWRLRSGLPAFRALAARLGLEPVSLGPDALRLAWPELGTWQARRLAAELRPRGRRR